jgi:hypothetical protein
MEEPNNSNTVTIFLLLVVCSLFVTIDGLELYRLVDQWDYALRSFQKETFEHCIQFPIIARTAFTIFSFMAAFSSFLIAFLLSINVDFFIEKISRAYLNMLYMVFGPYMLGCGLVGLFYWDKILYHCESDSINDLDMKKMTKVFSFSNMFNLSACIVLALIITVGMLVYESISSYINSIVQREEGSNLLRKLFWWTVVKYRSRD